MNILVTNDDGVYSNGIRALAREMDRLGTVYTVAPASERSATSHSLTLHRPLRVKKIGRGHVYAVNGTPTDCVHLALNGLLEVRPQIVVSGINIGPNLADDITYSGTVAAAIESTLQGVPAIAVSVVGKNRVYLKTAGEIAFRLVRRMLGQALPPNVLLNVNVPNLPGNRIKGYRFTRQGKRKYGESVIEKLDPRGEKYYWIGGYMIRETPVENSDIQAVDEGYISITPIQLDFTAHAFLKEMSGWRL
ncbi:MAG: 5'/3'-nucleotidase SurE [Deltaproteobacteria bacterium]|nr:5'/3'-nucleotidase SurE [Deltaproteobacteria bacterium]